MRSAERERWGGARITSITASPIVLGRQAYLLWGRGIRDNVNCERLYKAAGEERDVEGRFEKSGGGTGARAWAGGGGWIAYLSGRRRGNIGERSEVEELEGSNCAEGLVGKSYAVKGTVRAERRD